MYIARRYNLQEYIILFLGFGEKKRKENIITMRLHTTEFENKKKSSSLPVPI